ncbi:FAD-binding domain-containing protein [Actinopolymorpha pittospori]|uniref:Deoxyribodipyrimidine photo-lyase n=1 Tax=Actinopolymorpha pittospori TaxID=648752 RepID=A0A927N7A2_9ACTN|nr:deoxyribodipyrimidine photo-lyase [Actinopolymorpha pittospori]
MSRTTVVLFTRDLRVRDHPALADACRNSGRVVPLFVLDEKILRGPFASPNRGMFLGEALADLRESLRERGGDLLVRAGDPVEEALRVACEVGAERVVCSADVTAFARRRERRLDRACEEAGLELGLFPGVTVVPAGDLRTGGGGHHQVFTPYWRAWEAATWRSVVRAPERVEVPTGLAPGSLPSRTDLTCGGETSPNLPKGGESAARARLDAYARQRTDAGSLDRENLAADQTTRLSPYLHFGCVSPLTVATRLRGSAEDVVRQLCWRDFYHQVTACFPGIARQDLRPRRREWVSDAGDAIEAWRAGRTGVPIVDAGMRQLLAEGWMHNRARLVVGSFLTKQLGVDWRVGAAHFFRWLVDGDVANNAGNWQWVAGTGNDTRPNRVLNPLRQAARFDPDGDYVRRYVPELAGIDGAAVHEPWKLPEDVRRGLDYPELLIDPVPRRTG